MVSNERQTAARNKAAGLEASIACLKQGLTESKRAEKTALAGEVALHKEVSRLQNIPTGKRALEVDTEAVFTECKEHLVWGKEAMAMQWVKTEEIALTSEAKATGLEANIAFLQQE